MNKKRLEVTFNGSILKELLVERGMTQLEFTTLMGWKSSSQYKAFAEGNPTARNLSKAAQILGVSVDVFFTYHEVKNENDEGEFRGEMGGMSNEDWNKLKLLEKMLDENSKITQINTKIISCLEQELAKLQHEIVTLEDKQTNERPSSQTKK